MPRKHYFLGNEKHNRPQTFYIRPTVVTKYRGAIGGYRTLRVYKQIFEVMKVCKQNGGFITKGEFIAILRNILSTEIPTKQELNHFNSAMYEFRRFMGAVAGLVVYCEHIRIPEINGMEWTYKPIKNKTEYNRIVGKHIKKVQIGITNIDKVNKELLSMTDKQIENRINEVAEQLDIEAQGL